MEAALGRLARGQPVGVLRRYIRADDAGVWKDGLLMDLLAEELVRE